MTRDIGSRVTYGRRMNRFGDAVRMAREGRGWSQDELADRLGIERKTISRWETGEISEPKLKLLRQLIEVTGAPAESFLRAVGLLPEDDDLPALFDDPDVQAIWDLGERRGWPDDARWELIDLWRGRQMRPEDPGEGARRAAS